MTPNRAPVKVASNRAQNYSRAELSRESSAKSTRVFLGTHFTKEVVEKNSSELRNLVSCQTSKLIYTIGQMV